MNPINALSLAPAARNWLTDTGHPGILHVFAGACNLINERREVLSVVSQEIGNGPFNMVVDEPVIFSKHLSTESQISFDTNCLKIGEITIDIRNTGLWHPRPDWETLQLNKNYGVSLVASLPIANDRPFLPNSLTSDLSTALFHADLRSALEAISRLAGLGAGLTPAGDDFIIGAMYAAWIVHPLEIAAVITKEMAGTAAPLTTSLSAAWLRSAARGEAGILWHDLFDALISGKSSAIELSMNRILAVGETSGADALAGFVSVMARSQSASSKTY